MLQQRLHLVHTTTIHIHCISLHVIALELYARIIHCVHDQRLQYDSYRQRKQKRKQYSGKVHLLLVRCATPAVFMLHQATLLQHVYRMFLQQQNSASVNPRKPKVLQQHISASLNTRKPKVLQQQNSAAVNPRKT